jgi:hypothetical protein
MERAIWLGHDWGSDPESPNPVRLVQKILAVTQGRFSRLIDRDNDRLHMMVAVALQRRPASHLRKCLYPRRIVGLFIIPFGRVVRHGISILLNVGWLGATNLPVPLVSAKSADEGPHRRDRRAEAVEWFLTARRFARAAPVC